MIDQFFSDFGFEKYNSQKAKIAFFILMATADGYTDEMEVEFIKDRANNYGISSNEVQDIIDKVNSRAALLTTPETEGGKVEFVRELAQLVLIDEQIHPEEIKYGNQLCDNMGFQEAYFEKLLEAERKRSKYFEKEWNKRVNPNQKDYSEIMFQAMLKYPVQ